MKDRKILKLNNFKGLDTENKELKISPQMVSFGYNFEVEKGTLKTRRGLVSEEKQYLKENNILNWYLIKEFFNFKTNEKILGYYSYFTKGDKIEVFLTNENFYAFKNEKLLKLNININKEVSFSINKKNTPFFILDRGVLFIFVKGYIFVFLEKDNQYFFYDLKKMEEWKKYNVPEPYIPTLFYGDKPFEDINLLSKVHKYKLNAKGTYTYNDIEYILPTNFSYEKNKSFKYDFYYNGSKVEPSGDMFPIYIGIENEDYFSTIPYGKKINHSNGASSMLVDGIHTKTGIIEFWKTSDNGNNYNIIKKESFLDGKTFFNYKVNGVRILDYLKTFIKGQTFTENKYLIFELNIPYEKIFKDKNGLSIIKTERLTIKEEVLVQIKVNEINTLKVAREETITHKAKDKSGGIENLSIPDKYNPNDYVLLEKEYDISSWDLNEINKNKYTYNVVEDYAHTNWKEEYSSKKYMILRITYYQAGFYRQVLAIFSILKKGTQIENHKLIYDEDISSFRLIIKDYFVDLTEKPSIEIVVNFEKIDTYDLVANMTTQTTFGIENRLILGGSEEEPNIDRFNVSNDLLGYNDNGYNESQSYELTYFPSKNYRKVGDGNSKINGYVVATDNLLYITKDGTNENLFIRERKLNELGQVVYNEFKTNINITPINNKCLVRFNNDILILSEKGLFAIELSNNLLVNERLVKLRSGFINNSLINSIAKAKEESKDIFMVENNLYLYLVVGEDIYLANRKNIVVNSESLVENLSYDFVLLKYQVPLNIGFVEAGEIKFISKHEKYKIVENVEEDLYRTFTKDSYIIEGDYFVLSDHFKKDRSVYFIPHFDFGNNIYIKIGNINETYTTDLINNNTLGKKIILKSNNFDFIAQKGNNYIAFFAYEENIKRLFELKVDFEINDLGERVLTILEDFNEKYGLLNIQLLYSEMFFDYNDKKLYIKSKKNNSYQLVPYKVEEKDNWDFDNRFRLLRNSVTIPSYEETNFLSYYEPKKIDFVYQSGLLDFGFDYMEKTLFRINLFTSIQSKNADYEVATKTMRTNVKMLNNQLKVNNFDYDGTFDLKTFSMKQFNASGYSLPFKLNNFLYLQVQIKGRGLVEINGVEFIYKNNRALKTIS